MATLRRVFAPEFAAMDTGHRNAPPAVPNGTEQGTYLFRLSDRIRPLVDPAEIEQEACRLLGEVLAVDRSYYAEFDAPLEQTHVKHEYLIGGLPSLIGLHRLSDFA
jgi:hypothetical protein